MRKDERLSLEMDTQCLMRGRACQCQEVRVCGECEATAEYSAVLGGGSRGRPQGWNKQLVLLQVSPQSLAEALLKALAKLLKAPRHNTLCIFIALFQKEKLLVEFGVTLQKVK